MDRLNGAALLVKTLEDLGVDTVFGIPGIHNLDVYDSLIMSKIRHVAARHEAGAAFMADGYARRSEKPGVALVISGPGLTNALTSLGESYHDSVPVLLISSDIPQRYKNNSVGYLHELSNTTEMSSSVTKYSLSVSDADEIPEALKWLYSQSMKGRPGPVHLEVPIDVLQQEKSKSDEKLKKLHSMIENSGKRMVVVGGGARHAGKKVAEFAENINAAVVSTAAGKGVCPESHPFSCGGRIHLPAVKKELETADLVIALGTRLSPTDLWCDSIKTGGKTVSINLDEGHLYSILSPDLAICSDVEDVLDKLKGFRFEPDEDLKSDVKASVEEAISESEKELEGTLMRSSRTISRMRQLLSEIRKALGSDGVLVADMAGISYCAISEYKTDCPGGFLHPAGFGTLGYALPAAIGAKIAEPDKAVAVIAGDGGFQFSHTELAAAVQEKIPLPVIIWNDFSYGEIAREQYRRNSKRLAVDLVNPDFVQLAEAYGIKGVRISPGDSVSQVVSDALNTPAPTIIEVRG